MAEINGWYLPDDKYFVPFCESTPLPKKNGFQREHLLAAFSFVTNWEVAIDVGAYVGFWTLDMAEQFEQVYAFEPAQDSFDCLAKNMVDQPNVIIQHAAIGSSHGQCSVKQDAAANTGSRFVSVDDTGDVEMMALDELDLPGCDLLKVDVEGFEFAVIKGAKHLIRKHRPVIIMETEKKRFARRFGWRWDDAMNLLINGHGYKEVWAQRPDRVFIPRGHAYHTK